VQQRRNGFHAALARHGLKAEPSHCVTGNWSEEWGRQAVAQLFASGAVAPPDECHCGDEPDRAGRDRGRRASSAGLSVPQDVRPLSASTIGR